MALDSGSQTAFRGLSQQHPSFSGGVFLRHCARRCAGPRTPRLPSLAGPPLPAGAQFEQGCVSAAGRAVKSRSISARATMLAQFSHRQRRPGITDVEPHALHRSLHRYHDRVPQHYLFCLREVAPRVRPSRDSIGPSYKQVWGGDRDPLDSSIPVARAAGAA